MWKYITCPIGVTEHSALYNSVENIFKCNICTKDKVITSFDVEVLLVAKFIKFEKANPFIFQQTEIGRVGLPNMVRHLNVSIPIQQKDKEGNEKRARWHNIGKVFIYENGEGTLQLDSIPYQWLSDPDNAGRAKLFHPRDYGNPTDPHDVKKPQSDEPRKTEGFGGE